MNASVELNKANLEEMYLKEFLSIREIAEFMEVDKSVVHRRMIKFEIPRREVHELKPDYNATVPCENCGKEKLRHSPFKICKTCWDDKNKRERYLCGVLVPLKLTPRPKRKYETCLNCRGVIATWNRSGYCSICWALPGMKKRLANIFCKKCGKAITGHGTTGKCHKCSKSQTLALGEEI